MAMLDIPPKEILDLENHINWMKEKKFPQDEIDRCRAYRDGLEKGLTGKITKKVE